MLIPSPTSVKIVQVLNPLIELPKSKVLLFITVVESRRQEFLKCERDKQRIAREKSLNHQYELHRNLNTALLRKAQHLQNISSAQRAKQRERLESTIELNKRVEERLRHFKESRAAFAQQRVRRVFKQQEEMAEFFAHRLRKERSMQLHSQSLHFAAACNQRRRKLSQEAARKNGDVEVQQHLNEINERINKSLDVQELYNKVKKEDIFNQYRSRKRKAENSTTLNQRLDQARQKPSTAYKMRNSFNGFSLTASKPQSKLCKVRTHKSYKECFQHKEDIELKAIIATEKEIHNKEERFKMVCERKKEQNKERQELSKIKKNYREENIERVKARELLWRKETLERLRIPLKAYPAIAKAFY